MYVYHIAHQALLLISCHSRIVAAPPEMLKEIVATLKY